MSSPRKLKTYVIALPEAADRRRFMEVQLKSFPFMDWEFVDGVRGKDLSPEEMVRAVDQEQCRRTTGRTLSLAEVGSTLAHFEVMRRIEKAKDQVALVLEDDPLISGNFTRMVWQIAAEFQPDRPRIILLTPCKYFRSTGHMINGDFALRRFYEGFYASGYFINYEAARLIPPALLPLRAHVDWWKLTREISGVAIDAIVPYCVGISISENTASFINPSTSGGAGNKAAQTQDKESVLAPILKFGGRVRRGIYERALGIRGQRLIF